MKVIIHKITSIPRSSSQLAPNNTFLIICNPSDHAFVFSNVFISARCSLNIDLIIII